MGDGGKPPGEDSRVKTPGGPEPPILKIVGMITSDGMGEETPDEFSGALVPMAPSENFTLTIPRPLDAPSEFFPELQIPLKTFLDYMSDFHSRMVEAERDLGALMGATLQEGVWKEGLGRFLGHNFGKIKEALGSLEKIFPIFGNFARRKSLKTRARCKG